MQLLEVKNDIAKILYNPIDNKLLPSDFLLIEDSNQKLVGQILNIYTTKDSNDNIADVRLALCIDSHEKLSYYNGYIPPRNAYIMYLTADEITEMIAGAHSNIYLGNLTYHPKSLVKVPMNLVDEKLYIQSDREDNTKTIVQNIVAELYARNQKVILLDFDGRYNKITNVPRLTISESFKFPLNIDAFNNILEFDTVDCPIEDKAVIQSIVLELTEYIRTLDNKYLPFTLFKNVVNNEFAANPIPGLFLLRNKLWQYAQEGMFAENKSDFFIINTILANENIVIIDASKIEEKWHKFAIQTIPKILNIKSYFAFSLNDIPADKRTITTLYNSGNVVPIVSTSYDSPHRSLLKSLSNNQILFKPTKQTVVDEQYGALIHKLKSNDFILFGEASLGLPLIIELKPFDVKTSEKIVEQEIRRNVDKILSSGKSSIPKEAVILEKHNKHTEYEGQYTVEEDFVDDDLDFLDNRAEEKISIDDIKSQPIVNEPKKEYDVFEPCTEGEQQEEPKEKAAEGVKENQVAECEQESGNPKTDETVEKETVEESVGIGIVEEEVVAQAEAAGHAESAVNADSAAGAEIAENTDCSDVENNAIDIETVEESVGSEAVEETMDTVLSEATEQADTSGVPVTEQIQSSKNQQEEENTKKKPLKKLKKGFFARVSSYFKNGLKSESDSTDIDENISADSETTENKEVCELPVSEDFKQDEEVLENILVDDVAQTAGAEGAEVAEDSEDVAADDAVQSAEDKTPAEIEVQEEQKEQIQEEEIISEEVEIQEEQVQEEEEKTAKVEVKQEQVQEEAEKTAKIEAEQEQAKEEEEIISEEVEVQEEQVQEEEIISEEIEIKEEQAQAEEEETPATIETEQEQAKKKEEKTPAKVEIEQAQVQKEAETTTKVEAELEQIPKENEKKEEIVPLDSVIQNIKSTAIEQNIQPPKEQKPPVKRVTEQKQERKRVKNMELPSLKETLSRTKVKELKEYKPDIPAEMQTQFQIGDKVFHPKHGKGVVESFAHYSNKILFCQVEFENVGRRILDPRISGLKKLD